MNNIEYERQLEWHLFSVKTIISTSMIVSISYILTLLSIHEEMNESSFFIMLWASLITLTLAIFLHGKDMSGCSRSFTLYYVIFNVIMLFVVIYLLGDNRSFKTWAFLTVPFWIFLSMLSLNKYHVYIIGLIVVLSEVLMVYLAIAIGSIELGTIKESFDTPLVSMKNEIIKIIFTTIFTYIVAQVTEKMREKFITLDKRYEKSICLSDNCKVRVS